MGRNHFPIHGRRRRAFSHRESRTRRYNLRLLVDGALNVGGTVEPPLAMSQASISKQLRIL